MKTKEKYLCLPCFLSAEKVVLTIGAQMDILLPLSCMVCMLNYMQYPLRWALVGVSLNYDLKEK